MKQLVSSPLSNNMSLISGLIQVFSSTIRCVRLHTAGCEDGVRRELQDLRHADPPVESDAGKTLLPGKGGKVTYRTNLAMLHQHLVLSQRRDGFSVCPIFANTISQEHPLTEG